MRAYGPCVDPWLTCSGGGQDEQVEWPEPPPELALPIVETRAT